MPSPAITNGYHRAPSEGSQAGDQKIDPAITWFWKAMCHADSPEGIAAAVSQLSPNAYMYELVGHCPMAAASDQPVLDEALLQACQCMTWHCLS